MATIKQIYGTIETLTTSLDNLADTARTIVEIDNSANLHLANDFDITLVGAGTGDVDVYSMGSNTATDFPLIADNVSLWNFEGSIDMSSTKKKINFRMSELAKYNALLFVNSSGAALGVGNVVTRIGADLTNA